MKREPKVYLIGLGIPEVYSLTVEALAAIRRCRTLFVNNPQMEFFRRHCSDVRPIGVLDMSRREDSLNALTARILAAARKSGPVGFAIYGHPILYEPPGARLLEACRRGKIPFRVVAGISAFDAVLACLGLSVGKGEAVRVGDRDHFLRKDVYPDPRSHALIYKAGQTLEQLEVLARRFLEVFPGNHRVALVECLDSSPERARWVRLDRLGKALRRPELYTTLVVPALIAPPSERPGLPPRASTPRPRSGAGRQAR